MKNEKFYITTSIAYTNAPPHLGFALELIQADVLTRYHRDLGEEVFFLTGTDEHGQKVVKAAEEDGREPKEFTDEISDKFESLTKILNLSNNDFIRTTDQKRHWPKVKEVWLKLKENGDIYKKKYQGLYCVGCEAFITKKDLIDGKCKIHQKEPEVVEEENYFFKLSKYSKKIEEILKEDAVKIIPEERKNEMLSFVSQGLEDVSFSRPRKDLKWGIPVPDDDSQTIYVWADALINYLSALDHPEGSNFKKYWPPDVQFLGKDILRFHATIWLGILLSLNLPLPKNIFVHGFISVNGQKMSKSLGNVIDPFELVKKYGVDAVRYFLLREIPPTEDGDFTEEKFKERYNADLANGIGNTISRVLTMVEEKFNGIIPEYKPHILETQELRIEDASVNKTESIDFNPIRDFLLKEETIPAWKPSIEGFRFNICLAVIMNGFREMDKNINERKPWELPSNNETINHIFYSYLENFRILAFLISPLLPQTADKILGQLGLNPKKEKEKTFEKAIEWGGLGPGTKIKKGELLFPRLK